MTIGGLVLFGFFSLCAICIGIFIWLGSDCSPIGGSIGIIVAFLLIVGLFCGLRWYYSSTAAGQRAVVDERSNLRNGIERVVNVYTADGSTIATYKGKIDIDTNDGGYVKFDFEGKRYIYYNCFIETIADID